MSSTVRLIIGALIIGIGVAAYAAMFTVHEREQALVLQFGEPKRVVKEPGLYFKVPFFQNALYFDKRILDFDARQTEVPTLDQKQLIVDAFARYRIVDPLKFFQAAGTEGNANAQLGTFIEAALRETLGEVPMLRILTEERAVLMTNIADIVNRQAQALGMNVVDVRMKRVDLPEENSQAIFRRMQTQREQEARRIRAEGSKEARQIRAEADKQQRVILAEARKTGEITRGEGDAEAIAIANTAFGQDKDFFDFWRAMQAYEIGLNGETTTFFGQPQGSFLRYFDDIMGSNAAPEGGAN